jgi:hypothetical protein
MQLFVELLVGEPPGALSTRATSDLRVRNGGNPQSACAFNGGPTVT